MVEFKESKFYKLLQDFFINNNKETFLQMLAEFYNRTEGIIDKNKNQDDLIKELRELYLIFNEKGIDENIVREKVNYFLENNEKIKDINEKVDTFKTEVSEKVDNFKTEFSEQLDNIANKGTTVEVLERVTKEEINRQIQDGTIANLTIENNSITWDKFKNELKSNINQLVKNTTINNDGSVKEIFTDNKYKITTFENNVVNEKWYTSDNNLLFTKTTTLNPDGSISEALI